MAGGGFLTTHVLDVARGLPAAGLRLELHRVDGDGAVPLVATVTNADGRTDEPLLPADRFAIGTYQLTFHAGAYLDRVHGPGPEPRFLDLVPIRFGIADADRHYHVPLLLSPYGYSTYRGS